jgi:cytochrome b6-f complex iron-sulfur subunit
VAVAIVIIGVLVLAGLIVLVTTQRGGRTGVLSRETRARDAGTPASAGAVPVDDEAARARAQETKAQAAGVPAVPEPAAVTRWEPVDEEEIGVTRRQFFNRGLLASILLGTGTFGAGCLAFIWPTASGGFGGVVKTGRKITDVLADFSATKQPSYFAEARAYVVPYPKEDVQAAKSAGYPAPIVGNLEEGYIVLYQKCAHLGCRVPWCQSAQWFECPCHGSKYDRVGEKRDGPAPRGLSRWLGSLDDAGNLSIDTSNEYPGEPIGTDTTHQSAEGPHCV